jgi:hypothetical protein
MHTSVRTLTLVGLMRPEEGVFRRYHVGNNPINRIDPGGLWFEGMDHYVPNYPGPSLTENLLIGGAIIAAVLIKVAPQAIPPLTTFFYRNYDRAIWFAENAPDLIRGAILQGPTSTYQETASALITGAITEARKDLSRSNTGGSCPGR